MDTFEDIKGFVTDILDGKLGISEEATFEPECLQVVSTPHYEIDPDLHRFEGSFLGVEEAYQTCKDRGVTHALFMRADMRFFDWYCIRVDYVISPKDPEPLERRNFFDDIWAEGHKVIHRGFSIPEKYFHMDFDVPMLDVLSPGWKDRSCLPDPEIEVEL